MEMVVLDGFGNGLFPLSGFDDGNEVLNLVLHLVNLQL